MKRVVKAWCVTQRNRLCVDLDAGFTLIFRTRKDAASAASHVLGGCVAQCTITYDDGKPKPRRGEKGKR